MPSPRSEPARSERITAALADPIGAILAGSILGTTAPTEVRRHVGRFCVRELGAEAASCFSCELSVGAAFGLELGDGRRVFLKAYPPGRPREFLEAVVHVQRFLYESGFPAPRPLAGPGPLGSALAVAEEFVEAGENRDAHDPDVRRTMAATLARLVDTTRPFREMEALSRGFALSPEGRLWPTPHNALFDFELTAAGAEWIDELARRAKAIVLTCPARLVVGHMDWSVKHLRFEDGDVRLVYDWDSLRLERETVIVGSAAATFTYTEFLPVRLAPKPEESQLFVEEYEDARGSAFSADERRAVDAAVAYTLAYVARCEHAVDGSGDSDGTFRELLAQVGDSLLR